MYVMKGSSLEATAFIGLLALSCCFTLDHVTARLLSAPDTAAPAVFSVMDTGAKATGKPAVDEYGDDENSVAFIQAWVKACRHNGPAKVRIPPGKYVVAQVIFNGPCNGGVPVVEVEGQVLANPDPSLYPTPEWFAFENIDGVVVRGVGNGSFDGQGQLSYPNNDCPTNPNCAPPPSTIKFYMTNNSVIEGVNSVNSMGPHVSVAYSTNVTVRKVNFQAPAGSPSTEGVDISISQLVNVVDSVIGTGAECVSVGPGSTNVSVTGVTCGPGLGIGVTGLGKLNGELPVRGVSVSRCTFNQSDSGVVLKTLPGAVASQASGVMFENLVLNNVKNPMVIDQGQVGVPSHVQINDVTFKNISGTSASNSVISFSCSNLFPCVGVKVTDVNVKPAAPAPGALATCTNAKVIFSGNNNGLAC